ATRGLWPSGMPQSTDLTDLGLTSADIEAELDAEERARREREARRRTITIDGAPIDASDLGGVLDALRQGITDQFLAMGTRPAHLSFLTGGPSKRSSGGGPSGGHREDL